MRLAQPKRRISPAHLAFLRAHARRMTELRRGMIYSYFLTPAREKALRVNIRQARKSPLARGSHFRHGLYCVSLRATLLRAGESREEFEQHLARFERAFQFPAPRRSRELTAQVHAAAELVWRRLRAFRGMARFEAQRLRRVLRRAPEGGPMGALRATRLAHQVEGVFLEHAPALQPLGRVNRRLEELLSFLLAQRLGPLPPFRILRPTRRHPPQLAGKPRALLQNPLLSRRVVATWKRRQRHGPAPAEARLAAELAREKHRGFQVTAAASREECLRLFERAFSFPGAEGAPLARKAGETAWERLKCFHLHAEAEAWAVKDLLERAAAVAPLTQGEMHQVVGALLEIFAADLPVLSVTGNLHDRLRRLLGQILIARFGNLPAFDPFTAPRETQVTFYGL